MKNNNLDNDEIEFFSEELEERISSSQPSIFCKVIGEKYSYDTPIMMFKETSNKFVIEIWVDNKNLSELILNNTAEISIWHIDKVLLNIKLNSDNVLYKKATYLNSDIFKLKYSIRKGK